MDEFLEYLISKRMTIQRDLVWDTLSCIDYKYLFMSWEDVRKDYDGWDKTLQLCFLDADYDLFVKAWNNDFGTGDSKWSNGLNRILTGV